MILEVRNISHFFNDEKIFSDFSFYIRQKGCYLMQSEHTNQIDILSDLLCGYQKIQEGEIILQGVPASCTNPIYKSKSLLVNSDLRLDTFLTVYESLYVWVSLHYAENLNIRKFVSDLLKQFSISDLSHQLISDLNPLNLMKVKLLKCCFGHHGLVVFNQINFSVFYDLPWIHKVIAHLLQQEKSLLFLSKNANTTLSLNYTYQWKIEDSNLSDLSF
jgi:ABC-type multidrug transport system ATPase subunit